MLFGFLVLALLAGGVFVFERSSSSSASSKAGGLANPKGLGLLKVKAGKGGNVSPAPPPAPAPGDSPLVQLAKTTVAVLHVHNDHTPQGMHAVGVFQGAYNANGNSPQLVVDSKYGPKTRAALATVLGVSATTLPVPMW